MLRGKKEGIRYRATGSTISIGFNHLNPQYFDLFYVLEKGFGDERGNKELHQTFLPSSVNVCVLFCPGGHEAPAGHEKEETGDVGDPD